MPSTSSLVLKFDGRRIRPGFEGDDIGDIDLGGFETSSAVSENLHFIDEKIICVKYIVQNLRAENVSFQNPNSRSMKELLPDLFSTLDLLNKVALLSRQHKEGMDKRLIRYQNLAGKDWIKTGLFHICQFSPEKHQRFSLTLLISEIHCLPLFQNCRVQTVS